MTEIVAALDALTAGIAAARVLELDIAPAEFVHKEAADRLGIAPDSYVLALVGGFAVWRSMSMRMVGWPSEVKTARRSSSIRCSRSR